MFNGKNYQWRNLLSRKMTAHPLGDYIGQDQRNNSSHARSPSTASESLEPAETAEKRQLDPSEIVIEFHGAGRILRILKC